MKLVSLLMAILMIGLLAAVPSQLWADIAKDHYRKGNKLYNSRNYKEAEREYRKAAELKPGYWEAWHGLGIALKKQGRRKDALKAMQRSLAINPDNPPLIESMRRMQGKPTSESAMRVAVLDLKAGAAYREPADSVTEILRVELVMSGAYEVVDREDVLTILKEQAFQAALCTSTECAAEMGQILNCEKMFIGSLAEVGERLFLTVKRVDVATSKVDYANRIEAESEQALPEVAAVMVEEIVKGEMRRGKGKTRRLDNLVFRLAPVMWNLDFAQGFRGEALVSKLDSRVLGAHMETRFYPPFSPSLGFSLYLVPIVMSAREGASVHLFDPADSGGNGPVMERTSRISELGAFACGGGLHYDLGRLGGLKPRMWHLNVGAGLMRVMAVQNYTFQSSQPEDNRTGAVDIDKNLFYLQVASTLGHKMLEMAVGAVIYPRREVCSYQHAEFAGQAGWKSFLEIEDPVWVYYSLGIKFPEGWPKRSKASKREREKKRLPLPPEIVKIVQVEKEDSAADKLLKGCGAATLTILVTAIILSALN